MSIYATIFDVADDEHAADCPRLAPIPGHETARYIDKSKPCTCNPGPIIYRGSHILPSDDDPRGGILELAAIPGFIDAPGRPAISDDDGRPCWPWLRVSMFANGSDATVVLTRDQVLSMYHALGDWLMASDGGDA